MAVKASLQIILKANNVVVATSSNAAVWQQSLALITGTGKLVPRPANGIATRSSGPSRPEETAPANPSAEAPADAFVRFARDLDLDPDTVRAACNPTTTPPFLQLDLSAWEVFKRQPLPPGFNSVPQIVLATTLLALWFNHSDLDRATVQLGQAVLRTAGLRDKNPLRGLKHCEWLRLHDATVTVKPAKVALAVAVVRAFCGREPIKVFDLPVAG